MQFLLRWKRNQANESRRGEKRRPSGPVFGHLESLPLELLHMVLDRLDLVSLVCLRNTSSRFRALIPSVEEKGLSRCQKWLIMCRFENDMKKYPERVACAFCKVKHPQKDFGVYSKNRLTASFQRQKYHYIDHLNMMSSKPIERYCYRHLTSCLGWPPAYQGAKATKWVHTLEPTCLHCGRKPASCGQAAIKFCDGPKTRFRCTQSCDVCPTVYLSTYSRHGPMRIYWFSKESSFLCCFRTLDDGSLAMGEWEGTKR